MSVVVPEIVVFVLLFFRPKRMEWDFGSKLVLFSLPSAGSAAAGKFLKADGTWSTVPAPTVGPDKLLNKNLQGQS